MGAEHYNSADVEPPLKLVLLRHGESDWNRENRFTGWIDVDLSEGVEQARTAGRGLKAAAATASTSPSPRCSSARSARCGSR